MPITDSIFNAEKLIERLGRWPSFHDAEVMRVVLDRTGNDGPTASLLIHVWNTLPDVDARGYYRMEKHTLVELRALNLFDCEFAGFNHQNVILDLNVLSETFENEPAMRLTMSTSYGLSSEIMCHSLEVVSVAPCDENGQQVVGG